MNKLKLFISVGICSILFTGCGFFDSLFGLSNKQEGSKTKGFVCHPQDLKERLDLYYSDNKQYSKDDIANFINSMKGFFKDSNGISKCDDWIIERYKEVSNKTIIPNSYPAEIQFADKWNTCNAMPEWLNSKLNEYIEQNKNDDKAYIGASNFKEAWQTSTRFDGKLKYYDYWIIGSGYTFDYGTYKEKAKIYESSWKEPSIIERQLKCKAVQVATKAIENDLIDLDNGKKAKCADLSYKDAWRCRSHFDFVYKETKADLELKQQRIEYEKKNRQ